MEPLNLKNDKDLVKLYQSGSNSAINVLVQRHRDRLFTTIFYLVKNRELAEDLFQDAFVKIITNLKENKYNEQGKFLPWALRIAHNLVIDYFRTNSHMKMIRETEEYSPFSFITEQNRNVLEEMEHGDSIKKVQELINRLPEHQRDVVILRHYSGLSFKEIADHLNININTALSRMHFSVIELRKMMLGKDRAERIKEKKSGKKSG